MNLSPRPLDCVPLLIFAAIALSSPQRLLAFGGPPGGPYGNGSYFPTEGTFQATLRAVNLSGVATFNSNGGAGQSNLGTTAQISAGDQSVSLQETQASAGGFFTAFYEGTIYSGNVDGSINPSGGTVSATLEGSNPGNGNQTISNTISSNYTALGTRDVDGGTGVATIDESIALVVPGGTTDINLPDLVVVTTVTSGNNSTTTETRTSGRTQEIILPSTTVSQNQTVSRIVDNPDSVSDEFGWVDEVATSTFVDSFYAAGFFNAKLENSFPNQIFQGDGSITFTSVDASLDANQKIPVVVNQTVDITVRGVRISNTSSEYQSLSVSKPTVVTSISLNNRTLPTAGNSTNSN